MLHIRSAHALAVVLTSIFLCACATQQHSAPAALADASACQSACCAATAQNRSATAPAKPLISLSESVTPFQERFNARTDRARFVAILSSTCGPCVAGAVSVNETVLRGFKGAGIDVHVVWIDVLRTDSAETAQRASVLFDDPRVAQYHDPEQRLGKAFARDLVSRGPAWDIYLFYAAGERWDDRVPEPVDWMHQLGGGVADRSRYRSGGALATSLHEAMGALRFQSGGAAPAEAQLAQARDEATARLGAAAFGAAAEPARVEGRCERCAKSGSIGQCSISGWRHVVAVREKDEAGGLSNRLLISGAEHGPVELDDADERHRRFEYTIEGLRCPDCALAVVGKVFQVRGASRVEVDYDRKRLIVYAVETGAAKLDALPMHLGLAGYQVELVKD